MKNVFVPESWTDCLAVQIKETRQKLGLTQGEVASQLGVTRTSITNKEMGRQCITLFDVLLFCDLANVPIFDFLDSVNAVAAKHNVPQIKLKRDT